ncbi:MAG TPA: DUF6599 family protein [Polyangiaceae bacterium]
MTRHLPLLVLFPLAALSCKKEDDLSAERGAAPPPVASSKPGVCKDGGGTISDKQAAAFIPRMAGDYCVDPNGETRAYGEEASGTLDKACTELFDGECEVYKAYGLKRVVTLRYVDGKGSPGAVNVNLSRFENKDGAYGFFTKRVIADADPAESAPAKLEAGGAGALGTGIAYVWRGTHVAELSYTNELESPDQLKGSSARALPALAKELGEKLPGDKAAPAAVSALPETQRVNMGIQYEAKDVLGISGAGPGALGYYKDGDKRWRVFSVVRSDEDSAKDVMKTLKKLDGAKNLKNAPVEGLAFAVRNKETDPKIAWVVTRKGEHVFGVGDEESVLSGDTSAEEAAKVSLPQERKIEILKRIVDGGTTPGSGADSGDAGVRAKSAQ